MLSVTNRFNLYKQFQESQKYESLNKDGFQFFSTIFSNKNLKQVLILIHMGPSQLTLTTTPPLQKSTVALKI